MYNTITNQDSKREAINAVALAEINRLADAGLLFGDAPQFRTYSFNAKAYKGVSEQTEDNSEAGARQRNPHL